MSRHTIVDEAERQLVVGWDPPMGTFFAQEYDLTIPEDDDDNRDEVVWWVGYEFQSIPTLEEFVNLLATRGHKLSETTARDLCVEADLPWRPGPLQKKLGFVGKDPGPTQEEFEKALADEASRKSDPGYGES